MINPKTRVTFRIESELADLLRQLPNQSRFVEKALREALGQTCPTCEGTGLLPLEQLHISDFKALELPRLDRSAAHQLREIVRLGRQLLATDLDLKEIDTGKGLGFRLSRANEVLLTGRLPRATPQNDNTTEH